MTRIPKPKQLAADPSFQAAWSVLGIDPAQILDGPEESWTLSILEDLKPKIQTIQLGRLRWVLRAAMPLVSDFHLFVNREAVLSSKVDIKAVVEFSVTELPRVRMESLVKTTSETWRISNNGLVSTSFPSGISGTVMVAEQSLHAGKSADLGRSTGFFIRVRGRLVNEEDPLFGLTPLSYQTFNRFRAELDVDDLDAVITAPREGVRESEATEKLRKLLGELFYEARERYEAYLAKGDAQEQRQKEHERNFVSARLVEHPVADVLASESDGATGSEPDESWFYLRVPQGTELRSLVQSLYERPRAKYAYKYSQLGPSGRLVQFNPEESTFYVNADHEFVKAHADDGRSRVLLEDFVTAEALLEVYLREFGVRPHTIGEVLERRDLLLRGLARDHPFSLDAISQFLRDSKSNEYDLEVALVEAARSLGFVAKHISGAGEPDGLARLTDYPAGEMKITLEAKSSAEVPSLGAIDFAGLHEHMTRYEAEGCLLVAPAYPGGDLSKDSAAAERARNLKISCRTIDLLASVVSEAEARHLTANHLLDIVLRHSAPADVAGAVGQLLRQPNWANRDLYVAVVTALRALEGRLPDSPRTIDMIASEVSRNVGFQSISRAEIERAISDIVSASQGALTLRDDRVQLHASYDEIERRASGLTGSSGTPRRGTTFRSEWR